jgi:hypothetical protein
MINWEENFWRTSRKNKRREVMLKIKALNEAEGMMWEYGKQKLKVELETRIRNNEIILFSLKMLTAI